ncbi:uncharacterized protein LOC110022152 [Phalaenopsis equestris]|uniref:uncharacterized protein LOC110022152 n=1 Tax=Phalaenopsis equestris TaxID=78828 RepID=UPI0009E193AB|nr:uncharacterized protein LOC110022152 [Phalaenopsis equestris]
MVFLGEARTTWVLELLVILLTVCIAAVRGEAVTANGGKGRSLLGFRETLGNVSFQCSPAGPCIPCEYSEKNDEKYHCSETGYRLPLKCVESQDGSKEVSRSKNRRKLLFQSDNMAGSVTVRNLKSRKLTDDSSASENVKQSYTTYRSCIPVDSEEKLSVLGFELIMVGLLLISGPVVYLRQKRPIFILGTGATRIPTNSPRF